MQDAQNNEEAKSKTLVKVVVIALSIVELIAMVAIIYSHKTGA